MLDKKPQTYIQLSILCWITDLEYELQVCCGFPNRNAFRELYFVSNYKNDALKSENYLRSYKTTKKHTDKQTHLGFKPTYKTSHFSQRLVGLLNRTAQYKNFIIIYLKADHQPLWFLIQRVRHYFAVSLFIHASYRSQNFRLIAGFRYINFLYVGPTY